VEDASPAFWGILFVDFYVVFQLCVWLGILSQSRCKVICAVVQGPSSLLCYYASRFRRHKAGKNQGKNEAEMKRLGSAVFVGNPNPEPLDLCSWRHKLLQFQYSNIPRSR